MKKSLPVQKLARRTFRLSLESLETRLTLSAYTVSNLADSGPGSLRVAIASVNGDTTADVIDFSVAGVIKLTSGPLPAITNSVKIDGTSAPGFAGAPLVEIDNNGFAGLVIDADASTLQALSIVNANGAGVALNGNSEAVVGNYIGLALDGAAAPNSGVGLQLNASQHDTIGGINAADRNVISGNGSDGIRLGWNGSLQFVQIATIEGNFIGTDPTGQSAVRNNQNGILIFSSGSTVGGMVSGAGNVIASNNNCGILVSGGTSNAIVGNSIFDNSALGIALDNGGNANQLAPTLLSASQNGATAQITGIMSGQANTAYSVQIYVSPTQFSVGQGRTLLGTVTATTNASGFASFTLRAQTPANSGSFFTSLATSPAHNTSMFSGAIGLSTPNQAFIASAYGLLLNRAPDPGAAFWVNGLNNGTLTPASAVLGIEASEEYIRDQVDAMYLRYLHRAADLQGQQHFVGVVQAGATFEQVAEALVSSQEYYVLRGGTNQGFVTGLYADVLNRNASTAELAAWETALDSGASRANVAVAFLASQEYRTDLVQNDYTTVLLRAADPGGLAHWVNALNAAFTDQEVLAELLGSPEGYQLWS